VADVAASGARHGEAVRWRRRLLAAIAARRRRALAAAPPEEPTPWRFLTVAAMALGVAAVATAASIAGSPPLRTRRCSPSGARLVALAVRRWRWLSGRPAGVADAVAAVGRRALIAAGGDAKLSRGQLQGGAGDERTMIDVRLVWPVLCRVSVRTERRWTVEILNACAQSLLCGALG